MARLQFPKLGFYTEKLAHEVFQVRSQLDDQFRLLFSCERSRIRCAQPAAARAATAPRFAILREKLDRVLTSPSRWYRSSKVSPNDSERAVPSPFGFALFTTDQVQTSSPKRVDRLVERTPHCMMLQDPSQILSDCFYSRRYWKFYACRLLAKHRSWRPSTAYTCRVLRPRSSLATPPIKPFS